MICLLSISKSNHARVAISLVPESIVNRFVISDDNEGCEAWEAYNAQTVADYEVKHGRIEVSENEIQQEIRNAHWREDIKKQDEETVAGWREEAVRHIKWKEIRDPLLPEPLDFAPVIYQNEFGDSIRDRFKERGLQVYVKMASIELTPEKPVFPPGGWHVSTLVTYVPWTTQRYQPH